MRFGFTLNVACDREPLDALNHSYISFFQNLGLTPILVPNVLVDFISYINSLDLQGIILTGGNDISPERYGYDSLTSSSASELRDCAENELLQIAIEKHLLVLGICRGLQSINVFFGGRLIPDIRSALGTTVNHVGNCHTNSLTDVRIKNLLGLDELVVNSFHNQGITASVLAPALEVFAVCSGDGLIEGILHPIYPIMGIQWHPERPGSSTHHDRRLIQSFIEGALWGSRGRIR